MQKQLDKVRKAIDEINIVDDTLPIKDIAALCSGGLMVGVESPALYLDPLEAIKEWEYAVWRHLRPTETGNAFRLRWVEAPKLEQFIITMQDMKGSHRVVSYRYTVMSKLVSVEEKVVNEVEGREVPAGADRVAGSL